MPPQLRSDNHASPERRRTSQRLVDVFGDAEPSIRSGPLTRPSVEANRRMLPLSASSLDLQLEVGVSLIVQCLPKQSNESAKRILNNGTQKGKDHIVAKRATPLTRKDPLQDARRLAAFAYARPASDLRGNRYPLRSLLARHD